MHITHRAVISIVKPKVQHRRLTSIPVASHMWNVVDTAHWNDDPSNKVYCVTRRLCPNCWEHANMRIIFLQLSLLEAWSNRGAINLPICFILSKNNFTEILSHSSTALSRFYIQSENDEPLHLYSEHNLLTHGKENRLIISLNSAKHSEK